MTAPYTPEELDRLEALAMAATGGEWLAFDNFVQTPAGMIAVDTGNPIAGDSCNDTTFIAAFNPEAVRRLLAQVRAAEWQPIATAPKEPGSHGLTPYLILGFAADEEGYALQSHEGFWDIPRQQWVKSIDMHDQYPPQPTHWQPLPPPPARQEGSEG